MRSPELTTCVVEADRALDVLICVENANLAFSVARASFRVAYCLIPLQKDRLNAGRLVHLPAVSVRSDFDDGHRKN